VQSRLAEFTLNARLPRVTRIQSANQLTAHITRFGLVLSGDEVRDLTQLWQTTTDEELQTALAGLMGTFRPSSGLIGERLQRVVRPVR
jgi:hypothetical protein